MSGVTIDPSDVQGIVMGGFTHAVARFLLMEFGPAAGARKWMGRMANAVQSAKPWTDRPSRIFSAGVTFHGLRALGLPSAALESFPPDFKRGPRVSGNGAHAGWWDDRIEPARIHAFVAIHAADSAALSAATVEIRALAVGCGLTELDANNGAALDGQWGADGRVHFGFRDGISQPDVYWRDDEQDPAKTDFREFVLGYSRNGAWSQPDTEPGLRYARNGSYLALTVIRQDVAAFEGYLRSEAGRFSTQLGKTVDQAVEWLAAKMMGRFRNGVPVAKSEDGSQASLHDDNDFDYADDPTGLRCPTSAHVRVVNPRHQPLNDVQSSVPRLLRRGIPYGPRFTGPADAGADRGLIGMFLCSSLSRQFEKIADWIDRTDFSSVFVPNELSGQDAVMGNREPGARTRMRIRLPSGSILLSNLPVFTHLKGSGYFLIPSPSGLKALGEDI